MEKIFLSHSSLDKDYVRVVAKKLGREKIIFDEISFGPLQDFRTEISDKLSNTTLFVFFASKKSLESNWCRHELDEAALLKIRKTIKKHLTIIIDRETHFNDLPDWMKSFKAIVEFSPKQASREIESHFFSLVPETNWAPFVGRSQHLGKFQKEIASQERKKIFLFSGLDGIGRKTLLQRCVKDVLGMNLGPFFLYDDTKGLEDLYLWLIDEIGDFNSIKDLGEELKAFKALNSAEQINEIFQLLTRVSSTNYIPCLIDMGGILNENGLINSPLRSIIQKYYQDDVDAYFGILTKRKPFFESEGERKYYLHEYVTPFSEDETYLLTSTLLRQKKVAFEDSKLREVNKYIDGYGPACHFVSNQIESYGLDSVFADKSLLTDFKNKIFTEYVSRIRLDENDWIVLRYLANESQVPFSAISIALDINQNVLSHIIRKLLDLSLIVLISDNYSISPPIKSAVFKLKGRLDEKQYGLIRDKLTEAFWSSDAHAPSIEIVDATLHAVASSNSMNLDRYKELTRASIIYSIAQESYYQKKYELAAQYAERALQLGANPTELRAIQLKSYANTDRWKDAEIVLELIKKSGDKKSHYLEGFYNKKHQEFGKAIKSFELGKQAGDNSFPLNRDLSDCYYRVGQVSKSVDLIRNLLERQPDNIFVLDLALKIYFDSSRNKTKNPFTKEEAIDFLRKLERYDFDEKFIHHRKAAIFSTLGQFAEALKEAEIACSKERNTFEGYAIKIDILIEQSRFADAEKEFSILERKFGKARRNVQLGLRIKFLIRQGKWHDASRLWDDLGNKENSVNQAMRFRILMLKSKDMSLPLSERQKAASEADSIRNFENYASDLSMEDEESPDDA